MRAGKLRRVHQVNDLVEGGRLAEAVVPLRKALAAAPADPRLRANLAILLFQHPDRTHADGAEATALAEPLLDDPALPDEYKADLANNLAWAVATGRPGVPADLDRAEQAARQAVALWDGAVAAQDTLALVLVRRGVFDEAYSLAADVAARMGERGPADRASVACTQALAAAGLGRTDEARALVAEAERLNFACPLLTDARAAAGRP